MGKNNKVVKNIIFIIIVFIIISIIISYIFGTAINKFGLFKTNKILSNEGVIIDKKQEVYYDLKVPQFNHYLIIENKERKIKKFKINEWLYNSYKKGDYVKLEYYDKINEIIKIKVIKK